MKDDFTAQVQRFVRSAVFCAVRSYIGIGVWRMVFLGRWMWLRHWDLRFRVLRGSCVFVINCHVAILVDGSALRTCRKVPNVWCGVV